MEPDRWLLLKELFDRAVELDPARRSLLLDQACAGDSELRAELESLLDSHKNAGDFLEPPVRANLLEAEQQDPADRLLGGRLGQYEVQKKLGEGGMGVVYLAQDTRLGRQVAIKLLAPEYTTSAEHRERLKREARVAARLMHPAIAAVFALEEHGPDLFIVSEYVRGRTLLEELDRGPMPSPVLIATCIDLAHALAAAHDQGIIHRDLKPENVIRTPEGAIKILDFGLARFQAAPGRSLIAANRLTGTGAFLGTPAYASPEQLLGLEVDFRTDLFSFGVMMYEMASGVHPFASTDSITTIARILEAEPASLSRICPAMPQGLDPVVRRCLQKAPDARYGNTRELVSDLEQIGSNLTATVNTPTPAPALAINAGTSERLHPLWWWQFHQAVIGLLYYLMLYPMWKVKQAAERGWGSLLFFSCVAAVAVAANLRFHLWFTSAYYSTELAGQRRRVAPWIRGADILFVSLLLSGAIGIHSVSTPYTTLLIAVAIGCLCAFLLIEPTTTRAAFNDKSSPEC